MIGKISLTKI